MPQQGELKWVNGEIITKGDISQEIGNIDNMQTPFGAYVLLGLAGLFANGFLGIIIGGIGLLAITVDDFYDKRKDELTDILIALKGKPDSTKVQIKIQYRYTEKDGGLWIPTYELSYQIL